MSEDLEQAERDLLRASRHFLRHLSGIDCMARNDVSAKAMRDWVTACECYNIVRADHMLDEWRKFEEGSGEVSDHL